MAKGQRPLGLPTELLRIASAVHFASLVGAFRGHLHAGQCFVAMVRETHRDHARAHFFLEEGAILAPGGLADWSGLEAREAGVDRGSKPDKASKQDKTSKP